MQYSKFMANLYRYEKNSQKEISGVTKYENIGKSVKIGIKLCFPKKEIGTVKTYFILANKKKQYISFLFQGKMYQRIFSVQKVISEDELEKMNINISEIKGIYIIFDDKKYFVALWENEDIDFSQLELEKNELSDTTYKQQEKSEKITEAAKEAEDEVSGQEITEAAKEAEDKVLSQEITEAVKEAEDEVLSQEITEISKNSENEAWWQENCKASLLELRQLPKQYWSLGNNNFLLHGYYNYHHIYLKKFEKVWLVGVPGTFYPEEQKVAGIFGFDGFLANDEMADIFSCCFKKEDFCKKNVKYENGTFGYWFISVDIIE